MAYTQEQRDFFAKATAAGWEPEKIRAGIARLEARSAPAPVQTPAQTPAQPPAPVDDGTGWMKDWKPTDDMSTMDKFWAGMGAAPQNLALGARQLAAPLTGEDSAELSQIAADRRQRDAPLMRSPAGMVGNVAGNIAAAVPLAMAIPFKAPAAGAAGLARAATHLRNIGMGGAEGAAFGALAPTVEEGERGQNIAIGGTVGAALPAGGAAIRSRRMDQLTDKALDWHPFTYITRLKARNRAGKEAVDTQVDALKQMDAVDADHFKALQIQAKKDYGDQVASAKTRALTETQEAQARAAAEAAEKNTARDAAIQEARMGVAQRAGWDAVPANRLEMEKQVAKVGEAYGKALEPVRLNAAPSAQIAAEAAEIGGLRSNEAGHLRALAQRLKAGADETGVIPGAMYKDVRSEITEQLGDARGAYRDSLRKTLGALDESLQGAVDPDTYADILSQRQRFSLGAKLRTMDIDPAEPMDIFKARRHLDTRGNDATGARELLTEVVATVPKTPFKPAKVAKVKPELPLMPDDFGRPPVPRERPTFIPEPSDYAKLGSVNTLLTLLAGPGQFGTAPALASARALGNNKLTATTIDRLIRGLTQTQITD